MTCAQGLLRLLWGGGPKLECYGTALTDTGSYMTHDCQLLWHYDVKTTVLKSNIFPLLTAIMELFQILSIRTL